MNDLTTAVLAPSQQSRVPLTSSYLATLVHSITLDYFDQVSAALAAASTALASAQAAADKCSGANVLSEYDVGATKKAYEALIDNSDLEAADATRSGRDWVR